MASKPTLKARGPLLALLAIGLSTLPLSEIAAKSLSDFGYGSERVDVEALLRELADQGKGAAERYAGLIRKLDDDRFDVREQATRELLALPVLDREALNRALEQLPLEAAMRIERALAAHDDNRTIDLYKAALGAINDQKMKGLFAPLIDALAPLGDKLDDTTLLGEARDAARNTISADELPAANAAMRNPSAMARIAALSARIGIGGPDLASDITPLLTDPVDEVKWQAARELARVSDRRALRPLAELLMSDDFKKRWRAHDELRRLTDMEFDYYAAADEEERAGPAAAWLEWVDGPGKTAPLEGAAPAGGEGAALFNGRNLDGWKEVHADPDAPPVQILPAWEVDGDRLTCPGITHGNLHSREFFENFELTLEYRLPMGDGLTDSGLGIFATRDGDDYLEVQLLHGNSGDLYRIGTIEMADSEGDPIGFRAAKLAESNEFEGAWNKLKVRAVRGSVEIWVNDLLQNTATGGPEEPRGIVFRNEGDRVEFRGIRLKKL